MNHNWGRGITSNDLTLQSSPIQILKRAQDKRAVTLHPTPPPSLKLRISPIKEERFNLVYRSLEVVDMPRGRQQMMQKVSFFSC